MGSIRSSSRRFHAAWRQTLPGDKAHKFAAVLGATDPDRLYHRLVSVCNSPEDFVIGGVEPPATPILDPSFRRAVPDFTERMMLLDQITYLPDDILVKVDRASMAVGLEARSPLLDHRLVEWAWRLPFALKHRQGESKWVLRRMLERHVPKQLTDRPKMGFGVPLDRLATRTASGVGRDTARPSVDSAREGFFNPERRAHDLAAAPGGPRQPPEAAVGRPHFPGVAGSLEGSLDASAS